MSAFMGLCRNEWIKLNGRRRVLILALVMLVFVGGITALTVANTPHTGNWQTANRTQIQMLKKSVAVLAATPMPRQDRSRLEAGVTRQLAQERYLLVHDVPPASWYALPAATVLVLGGLFELFFLMFAWFAAETVAHERSEGTIKLILSRPATRTAVLAAKAVTLFALSAVALLFGVMVSYVVAGAIAGHWGGFGSHVALLRNAGGPMTPGNVVLLPAWLYLLLAWSVSLLAVAVAQGLGLVFSAVSRGVGAAVGLSLGVLLGLIIAGAIMGGLLHHPAWLNDFFFTHMTPAPPVVGSAAGAGGPPTQGGYGQIATTIWVLALWAGGLYTGAFVLFQRRDELA